MTSEYDAGLGTTREMWSLASGLLDGERLPRSLNFAIAALRDGGARVVSQGVAPAPVGDDMRPDAAYNHPAHYGGDTTYEVIKVVHAWGLGFNLGNTLKYIGRLGKKDPGLAKRIEDLRKARWYLDYEIRMLEAEHHEN